MPLDHGYGVVVGTRHSYYRDPVNEYGQYYHGNLRVATPAGIYHCAIDVDSKSVPNGVLWKVVELRAAMLKGVQDLPDGWHVLATTSSSGALDYLRNPDLRPRRPGCLAGTAGRYLPFVRSAGRELPWKEGVSTDALADLEPLVDSAARVFVFGEPFHGGGLGVHNIHQNQGDPITSKWSRENGIWQDGATLVQRSDGSFAVFCNKFATQASETDAAGRPVQVARAATMPSPEQSRTRDES